MNQSSNSVSLKVNRIQTAYIRILAAIYSFSGLENKIYCVFSLVLCYLLAWQSVLRIELQNISVAKTMKLIV